MGHELRIGHRGEDGQLYSGQSTAEPQALLDTLNPFIALSQ